MKISIVGFLKMMLMGLMMVTSLQGAAWEETQKTPEKQEQVADQNTKVSINSASAEQLTALPRVGPVIAERIVAFRKEHEGFKSLKELMNVSGIGPKTFEKLAPLIRL